MLDTRGNLERVRIEGDTLKLEGWAAAVGAGAIEDFKVTCAGRELAGHDLEARLPSPDVKAAHPSLDESGRCRFRIHARLDEGEGARARNSVITCTPRAPGGEGRALIHLIDPVVPSPSAEDIAYVGTGFLEVSSEFLGYFIQLADLRPDSDVLDVGCGVGRMAYMLAHYLTPEARYEGFDIVERLIAWAQQSISPHVPNFRFQRSNIYNKWYNPGGAFTASEFRFPYEDESFDFLFLTSVFTHMMAADVRHYLDEFRRVLRPGGHCLTTCFLLNDESEALIREGRTTQNIAIPLDECFTTNPDVPEDAIGYKEPLLLGWIADRGFTLRSKHYGCWCDRPRFTSYQDILVYKKTAA
jgi:SAM-dependent methyltransferase